MQSKTEITALIVAIAVALAAGTTTAYTARDRGPADSSAAVAIQEANVSETMTAQNVEAEVVRMRNVELSNVTVEGVRIGDDEGLMTQALKEALSDNVQGLQAGSIRFGNIQSARILINNSTATVDANLTAVTLRGVQANRVNFNSSQGLAEGMVMSESLSANSTTIRELTVGRLSIEKITQEPATSETPTPTPPANETAIPTPPADETATPTPSPTPTPADNETATPAEPLL